MSGSLMWFRRDLRLSDNTALHHALREAPPVYCAFCFDREILDALQDHADRRVHFIHQSLRELESRLRRYGAGLIVCVGHARTEIPRLAAELQVDAVYANHDYEPQCRDRDAEIAGKLRSDGRELRTFKDHVIFEENEILSAAGTPFRVYTPYRNAWRAKREASTIKPYAGSLRQLAAAPPSVSSSPWELRDLGFEETDLRFPAGERAARRTFDAFLTRIDDYARVRDYPAVEGTSRLSVHLRFGTIGIREVVTEAHDHGSPGAGKWIDELIWRDFHNMVLHHFPHTQHRPFQPAFESFRWRQDRADFEAWCEGRTGYPIVDAGMRELNITGFMHNRLRMIAASFLTKDLLIDWTWGERYFARKLIDYDLSQNLGGWQWSAGIGTDAQPFFRVFNPVTQSRKFDTQGAYIRTYIPELARIPDEYIHAPWLAPPLLQSTWGVRLGNDYPLPIVDHGAARERALAAFQHVRSLRMRA